VDAVPRLSRKPFKVTPVLVIAYTARCSPQEAIPAGCKVHVSTVTYTAFGIIGGINSVRDEMISGIGLQADQIKAEIARGILDLNRGSFAVNYISVIFKEDIGGQGYPQRSQSAVKVTLYSSPW